MAVPSPSDPQKDPQQLAKELSTALGVVIKEIRDAKNSPHLVDSKEALAQQARNLQHLHELAQKAQAVEA